MEADMREVVARLEDTASEPGDLPAQRMGEAPEGRKWEEVPLTDYQIGMLGGGLIGFAVGLLTAALIALVGKEKKGNPPDDRRTSRESGIENRE